MAGNKQLTESPAARRFLVARDRALETLLNRAIAEANDLLRDTLTRLVSVLVAEFPTIGAENAAMRLKTLDAMASDLFDSLAKRMVQVQARMMAQAAVLSYLSTAEALGRAMAKTQRANVRFQQFTKNEEGEDLVGRARVTLLPIKRDLMDAIHASVWISEDLDAFKRRLLRALPERTIYKRPPRVLKPITEAEDNPIPFNGRFRGDPTELQTQPFSGVNPKSGEPWSFPMFQGFMDDEAWKETVQSVLKPFVPSFRGPEAIVDSPDELKRLLAKRLPQIGEKAFRDGSIELRYAWQFEREMAHELVRQTERGQNQASADNGIKSFEWVAVIDDATCQECCQWRNGLNVAEIAHELQNEHSDDECQAFAPPAHFNCRCRLIPILQDDDLQPPPSELPEFEEWLMKV